MDKNRFSGEKLVLNNIDYVDYFVSRAINPNATSKLKYFRNRESNSHILVLFALSLSVQAKSILEIGVRRGSTTLPLLYAAFLMNGGLDSVDIKKTKFQPPKHMRKYWKFYHQDSIKFLERIPAKKTYDLVFLDGCHAADHVRKEIKLLEPHISIKTVILLHDLMLNTAPHYNPAVEPDDDELHEGGPYLAVLDLDRNKWEFATIPVMHGLTLLRRLK